MSYTKKTLLLIAFATLLRCIVACCIELGNDEVYYRMYAQYLHWNYFDHPPMVGWLIRFTTVDLLLDNALFIRLGAIVCAAATTWLLFACGKKLANEHTGYLAAFIYTVTVYGSIIAGTFILPDSPQMVCWAAGLYVLIGIAEDKTINQAKRKKLLWFGCIAGIGMLCKIHTSFLWLGLLLYIVLYNRKWLAQPVLYIAGIITLLFFYPVIQWNIDNHFVTYLYHSKRVDIAAGGLNISSFISFFAGQLLYFNPVIFPFFILGVIAAIKNKVAILASQKQLLLLCSMPLIGICFVISLFKEVLPHWTGPAYCSIILLTACYFSSRRPADAVTGKAVPKPLLIAAGLLTAVVIAGIVLINFLPGTLGKKDTLLLGEGDFTLDMYGWNKTKTAVQEIIQQDSLSGVMKGDAVIISNKWFSAAHIDHYIAMSLKKRMIAIGDTSDIHQYAWINAERKNIAPGDDAYCIVPSDNYFNTSENYAALFRSISAPVIIEQKRNGETCRLFYVYRLKGYLGK